MKGRRIFILLFFLNMTLYGLEIEKSKVIEITADIYLPIILEKESDIDFGKVPAGAKDVKSQIDGKLKIITDSSLEKLKITWKDESVESYVDIDSDIDVILYSEKSQNSSLKSRIKATKNNEEKSLNFSGNIPKIPINSEGIYRGEFIVRVEYR